MQTSGNKRMTQSNHRKVQASTTLNRKYTKRPAKSTDVMVRRSSKAEQVSDVMRSPKVQHFSSQAVAPMTKVETEPIAPATVHPMQQSATMRMQARKNSSTQKSLSASVATVSGITAKELKDQAIKKALAQAEKVKTTTNEQKTRSKKKKSSVMHFGVGRVLLALSCAATAVFAIVYFVNLNMPDVSLKVAAMQTGIDPTYPNYVPRDYSVSSITSQDGRIDIIFYNSTANSSFTLTEEKSSWDTSALESNFVKSEYGENYTLIREQGLSIYINGSNAAWVNGGIVYKITANNGVLTNKQIRSIATSL